MELEIGSTEAGVVFRCEPDQLKPQFVAPQFGLFFQRIMRSYHKPHLIQSPIFAKVIGQSQMPDMDRIERPAEYSGIKLVHDALLQFIFQETL